MDVHLWSLPTIFLWFLLNTFPSLLDIPTFPALKLFHVSLVSPFHLHLLYLRFGDAIWVFQKETINLLTPLEGPCELCQKRSLIMSSNSKGAALRNPSVSINTSGVGASKLPPVALRKLCKSYDMATYEEFHSYSYSNPAPKIAFSCCPLAAKPARGSREDQHQRPVNINS